MLEMMLTKDKIFAAGWKRSLTIQTASGVMGISGRTPPYPCRSCQLLRKESAYTRLGDNVETGMMQFLNHGQPCHIFKTTAFIFEKHCLK